MSAHPKVRPRRADRGNGVTTIRLGVLGNWQCWYCGQPLSLWTAKPSSTRTIGRHKYSICEAYPEIEHKIPRSRGGETTLENCVIACRTCNIRKGTRTADEYLEELYYWELEYHEQLAELRARWADVLEYRHEWS